MVKISVIVPVYNVEHLLPRCIDSILGQTFQDFELILVNDCSSDNSGQICDNYAKTDCRIKALHKTTNAGVSAARNTGLSNAVGDFIAFCDSDDYVDTRWLETLYTSTLKHCVDFIVCGFQTVSSSGIIETYTYPLSKAYDSIESVTEEPELFWRKFLRNENHLVLSLWNKLFKREIISTYSISFDETLSHSEDFLFVMSYFRCSNHTIAIINRNLYYYWKDDRSTLTARYKPDYWPVKQNCISKLRLLCSECGITDLELDFETYTITLITVALQNILRAKNELHIMQKIYSGNELLHSDICKSAFSLGEFHDIHPIYKIILKTRRYELIYLFHLLVGLKQRIYSTLKLR